MNVITIEIVNHYGLIYIIGLTRSKFTSCTLPWWSRFNPNGAVGEDLGTVLKPKLDSKLDA